MKYVKYVLLLIVLALAGCDDDRVTFIAVEQANNQCSPHNGVLYLSENTQQSFDGKEVVHYVYAHCNSGVDIKFNFASKEQYK